MNIAQLVLRAFGLGRFCAAFLFCTAAVIVSQAQTFTNLLSFDGPNGANPYGTLIQANDGNFYGTSYFGGANGGGTAFVLTPAGQLTTLYNFCSEKQCSDGGEAFAGLVQATDGSFYGTTSVGGNENGCDQPYGCGTAFSMTSTGEVKPLYDFGPDNFSTTVPLVQSGSGDLYGLRSTTVFKMTPEGKLTTVYTFSGSEQIPSGITLSPNGNFYITTYYGGANGFGAIYKMTPEGQLTTLYNFCQSNCTDGNGNYPDAALVQGNDGNLYGTTTEGGAYDDGGTVFKITQAGKLTTLYNFCAKTNCADGSYPRGLVLGNDGNFYGVTYYGGNNGGFASGEGTLYKITPAGKLTTLYSFCSQASCADGANPFGSLLQGTDGNFYGTTLYGGSNASACPPGISDGLCGTAFRLSTGLGPFVKLLRQVGSVGQSGGILGQGFTGTTGVFLNGTPASFTVVSDTYITATVPAGATSGYVTVDTPSGTLTSNAIFHVLP